MENTPDGVRSSSFSIFCDESCHLENDKQGVMLLGCIWAESKKVHQLSAELKKLKKDYGVTSELKWTKVSPKNLAFYISVVNWFFSEPSLHFRTVVVPNKAKLDHARFNQLHDDFYYKLYFWLLSKILYPDSVYKIYLDIKDTRSRTKVQRLKSFLCFDKYDFSGEMISDLRSVRSHEIQLMQLADFLLGAVAYSHRNLSTSLAKSVVVKIIEANHGKSLKNTTYLSEDKFNVFVWRPQ